MVNLRLSIFGLLFMVMLMATTSQAAFINFDATDAPTFFNDADPLTDEFFESDGVTWAGGGAVLNAESGFGVSGFSSPNFLAYNSNANFDDGTSVQSSDSMFFSTGQSVVSFLTGVGEDLNYVLLVEAFNESDELVDNVIVNLDSIVATVQLASESGNSITRVDYRIEGNSGGAFIIDDLRFESGNGTPPVQPVPEPSNLMILGAGLIALAGFGRKLFPKNKK